MANREKVKKNILFITIGILALGAIGFFVARNLLISQPPAPQQPPDTITGQAPDFPDDVPPSDELPEPPPDDDEVIVGVPTQRLLQLTDFPIVSPTLNKDQDRVQFYQKNGGDLLTSDFDGAHEKISNITIVGIQEAVWSPKKDRAAVFYLDNETLKAFLHIGTSSVAVLPQNITSFSWSPTGNSLAYTTKKDNRLTLATADEATRDTRAIASTPLTDASIIWASANNIAFTTAPSGFAQGFSFLFSRTSGTFSKSIGPLFGLSTLFSPDGSKIVTSSTPSGGRSTQISLFDKDGTFIKNLERATLAQKCTWAGNTMLYCASPRFFERGVVWPDDYLRGELNTQDKILVIDTEKNTSREIFNEHNFDISDLIVTTNEDYLFFVDRHDGTLWRLEL